MTDNDNQENNVVAESKPSMSKLSFSKLGRKSNSKKEEERAKQTSKQKKQKPTPKKEAGKSTFMQSLREMFEKKLPPETAAVIFKEAPSNAEVIETYIIQPSYSQVTILSLPELGGGKAYFISEVKLTTEENDIHRKLSDMITKELEPLKAGINPIAHIDAEAERLAKKYGLLKKQKKKMNITPESWAKILYYLHRDFLGFGHIHVVMNDPMIEDISVNGMGMPVYVWHRKYESMPTNLTFIDENALDNLIVKLTHLSSKHISTAFPILDAMLPGKDRLAATFKREVSPKGGSFTIRRFREEPFSIVDLDRTRYHRRPNRRIPVGAHRKSSDHSRHRRNRRRKNQHPKRVSQLSQTTNETCHSRRNTGNKRPTRKLVRTSQPRKLRLRCSKNRRSNPLRPRKNLTEIPTRLHCSRRNQRRRSIRTIPSPRNRTRRINNTPRRQHRLRHETPNKPTHERIQSLHTINQRCRHGRTCSASKRKRQHDIRTKANIHI